MGHKEVPEFMPQTQVNDETKELNKRKAYLEVNISQELEMRWRKPMEGLSNKDVLSVEPSQVIEEK